MPNPTCQVFPAAKSPWVSQRRIPIPNGAADGIEQRRRPVDPASAYRGAGTRETMPTRPRIERDGSEARLSKGKLPS